MERYQELLHKQWKEVFYDSGKDDYKKHWFKDGLVALIINDENGMTFKAGPMFDNDAHHDVLWTKEIFEGDLKIEYDFTRLDKEARCVNIIYIQASGMGQLPYYEDIAEWKELRSVPAMDKYYSKMHTYHISYAAFTNDNKITPGYIRARRYMADKLEGTEIKPDYSPEGFFEPGVKHHFTIIKKGQELFMHISNNVNKKLCYWNNRELKPINKGRIGLRQMATRQSRYENIKIFKL